MSSFHSNELTKINKDRRRFEERWKNKYRPNEGWLLRLHLNCDHEKVHVWVNIIGFLVMYPIGIFSLVLLFLKLFF